jgi:hypothetical protein
MFTTTQNPIMLEIANNGPLCNYHSRFVKEFNSIVKPLIQSIKIDDEYIWVDAHEQVSKELKVRLTFGSFLRQPIQGRPF